MTHPSPDPSPTPPSWPQCGHGADPATDPVGCRGIHVPGHTACLAHLDEPGRAAYLATLAPGADINHCGTSFTADLLGQLLDALRDPTTGRPHIGDAQFNGATFTGAAKFGGATFARDAQFIGARFEEASQLGPLTCGRTVMLDGAVFGAPVTVEIAAREVSCVRTRWASTATLRLRHAELDLSEAVFEYPVAVTARSTPCSPSRASGAAPCRRRGCPARTPACV